MAGTPRLFSVNAVMSLLSRFAARSALIHVSEALVSKRQHKCKISAQLGSHIWIHDVFDLKISDTFVENIEEYICPGQRVQVNL